MNRFQEIKPALRRDEALMEANRCLMCYDAPCIRACPTHIDVPGFIKKISTDNLRGSAKTILDANIFGGSCARVCPTEELCEGACVLHDLHEKPIKIGQLQRYATDWLMIKGDMPFSPGPDQGKTVAIIGAGPAGVACAAELRRIGYSTVVFDAAPQPGGLNTYGVAEYKMTPDFALAEIAWIEQLGINIRRSTVVGRDVTLADLERDYAAVFIAVGLGEVPALGLPGEDLPGVMEAIDFIARLKMDRENLTVPRRVAVIGGGNTAIDCVTQAVRLGADEVTLVYRRGAAAMTAYDHEIHLAKQDGVRFVYEAMPVRIEGSSRATGLTCQKAALGLPDVSGRQSLEAVPGSHFTIEADLIIRSTGQGPVALLRELPGIATVGRKIKADPTTFQTSNPKYFAAGDVVSGGQEVVNAVANGKIAARSIHTFLSTAKELVNG
ncbi:MAG: NAD(P)-dependent oxidoreductase [Candidatus Sericytochromatia bacterium]|nr:NAD(P)-dependent oxidoreductase [Candidatus Sericytochromatia bacterium]